MGQSDINGAGSQIGHSEWEDICPLPALGGQGVLAKEVRVPEPFTKSQSLDFY